VESEQHSEVEKFDRYAQSYAALHAANVAVTGEVPEYFARHKLDWLVRLGTSPDSRVLDYGCGTGALTELLVGHFAQTAGYDPSRESLPLARQRAPGATFYDAEEQIPKASFDLVVLSGVLHHVAPEERLSVLQSAAARLRSGGRLCVFEHNPLNPFTVRAVRTCPFDDAAILLSPGELRRLFAAARLHAVRQDFVLFFPRALARLRPFEPWLRGCPLGAQTLTHGIAG
jgi:SAM-dependent methyltransferase